MTKKKNFNKYNKTWTTWFSKNKTKELYNDILLECFPEHKRCTCCNGPIYYYDSTYAIDRDFNLYINKKSYLSQKEILGNKYNLSVCEDCLTKKFPEYQTLNKSRVFNRICDITNYAFNIPDSVSTEWKQQNYAITLDNLIIKHGIENGTVAWEEYCRKQSETNTFEYKQEKYGWTKKQFNEYNKTRSTTLENLIIRHGEVEGKDMWKKYIDRQRYTCSLDYFLKEYGEDIGREKYRNFAEKRVESNFEFGYSEISQKIFHKIKEKIDKEYTYYYADDYNREKMFNDDLKYYLIDFYIKELNIAIEFNGDLFHANPEKFDEYDKPNPFDKELLAKTIWEKDRIKIDFVKTKVREVIIVWEKELKEKGIELLTDELVEKIKTYE